LSALLPFDSQELPFSVPAAIIPICKVAPVVAAIHRFKRAGDLGLNLRSNIQGFFNARDSALLPRDFYSCRKREKWLKLFKEKRQKPNLRSA
jgi:hypothetical protein